MLLPGSRGHGKTQNRKTNVQCVWMIWSGITEWAVIGQLGGYRFQGATFGVDWSSKDWKIGSGCYKIQGDEADKCTRVGKEEESTSSNRPELGGVVLALQSAALSKDVLLWCDNEAVLYVIKKWVVQGEKATLATAPHGRCRNPTRISLPANTTSESRKRLSWSN